MSYTCRRADDWCGNQHPNQANAVYTGCEQRPPRPYSPGDTVVHLGREVILHKVWWDIGQGWLACGPCGNGYCSAPRTEDELTIPRDYTEPDLFEVCS